MRSTSFDGKKLIALIVLTLTLMCPHHVHAMISSHFALIHARILLISEETVTDPLAFCPSDSSDGYNAEVLLTWIAEDQKNWKFGGSFSNSSIPRIFFAGYPLRVKVRINKQQIEPKDIKAGSYVSGIIGHTIKETHQYPCMAINNWWIEIDEIIPQIIGIQEETLAGRVRTARSLFNTDTNQGDLIRGLEKYGTPAGAVWLDICTGRIGGLKSFSILSAAVKNSASVPGASPVLIDLLTRVPSEYPDELGLSHPREASRLAEQILSSLRRVGDSDSIYILKKYAEEPDGRWLYTDENLRAGIKDYVERKSK